MCTLTMFFTVDSNNILLYMLIFVNKCLSVTQMQPFHEKLNTKSDYFIIK